MKIRNSFGTQFSGTIGKDMIASSWRGREYIKEYVRPTDPKTELQLKHRAVVAEAVKAWKGILGVERQFYEAIDETLPAYHTFIRRYVKAVSAGNKPTELVTIDWKLAGEEQIENGYLIVQRGSARLFTLPLSEGGGCFALGNSDAPYSLHVRRGTEESDPLGINRPVEANMPPMFKVAPLRVDISLTVRLPKPKRIDKMKGRAVRKRL